MAIGVTLKFPGATADQYDRTCALMGLTPGGAGPHGLLFHWSSVDDAGLLVTDVWTSPELFEAFARDQIGPLSQQAGITAPPETEVREIHNYFTAGALTDTTSPIAAVAEYQGDLGQYDEVVDLMGFTPTGPGADGGMFHWVAAIDGGARITDVWQDRASFDAFTESYLIPYTAKVNVAPPTSMTMYDVHNFFTAGT